MKSLIRLYPARWRRRYGAEMSQLLDDLRPMPLRIRFSTGIDLLRGAFDAHLATGPDAGSPIRAAVRRAVLVAAAVWAALSVEIVLTNVVFPANGDDDLVPVLICAVAIFLGLGVTGSLAARVATGWPAFALAGAVAGGLIAGGTMATYLVVDNAFLSIVSQQEAKVDGFAHSGMSSMRAYVNISLLYGLATLSAFLAVTGAGLAVAAGLAAGRRRPARAGLDARRSA